MDNWFYYDQAVLQGLIPKVLPKKALFHVPPIPTCGCWSDASWVKWWYACGGKVTTR
jgi:hypothetical protein